VQLELAAPCGLIYIEGMKEMFPYILFVFMAGTAFVLVWGLINMFNARKNKNKKANDLMRWRIMLQAGALCLFAAMLFLS